MTFFLQIKMTNYWKMKYSRKIQPESVGKEVLEVIVSELFNCTLELQN